MLAGPRQPAVARGVESNVEVTAGEPVAEIISHAESIDRRPDRRRLAWSQRGCELAPGQRVPRSAARGTPPGAGRAPQAQPLTKQIPLGRHHELGRGAVASDVEPADDHDRQAVRLGRADEVRGAGELVGDGDLGRAKQRSGAVRRPAQVASGARPATPIATSVVPRRNGRPNESVTITATSSPVRSWIVVADPRALASESTGRSTTVPGSAAFEWSTPAEAQTKP